MNLKLLTLKSCCLNVSCLCSSCELSCVTAMVASGIQFEQCFFLRDRVDNDHGKCTLTKQLLSRADPAHRPYNVLSEILYFIIKQFKLIILYFFFLLQKGKLLPEKQVIFSVLFFLPTQRILNYSVCLMLIFGTNQRRCSWKKPLLRIPSSDTVQKNWGIWHLNSGRRSCFAHLAFGISLTRARFCAAGGTFSQSVRTSAGSAMCCLCTKLFQILTIHCLSVLLTKGGALKWIW